MPVTFYRTLVDLVKSWKTLTTRELVKFAGEIEARLGRLEGQSADVDATLAALRQVALDRINLVLTPAIEKVFQIQERGFLIAHSSSSNTLGEGNILTFDIEDEAERELFTPSPFLALTREDNAEDVGIARLVSYSQQHGELIVEVVSFFGAAGPHTDWVIAATAGPTVAQLQALDETTAARDLARDWAEKAQGEDVDGVGTRSAKHYALACAAQLSAMQELYDDIGAAAILVAGGAPVTSVAGEVGVISAAALKLALAIEIADVDGLSAALSGKADAAALAGKADSSHTHAIADVTNLQNSLDAKAPLASPALTGNPTAPTQSGGNNTTRIATTAFVQGELAALVNSSPSALDTLNELAAALGNDANFATTMTNALATKALKDVQEFTSSGTWSKPAGATMVMVELLGAGGGGGAGKQANAGQVRPGGSGGGGGEYAVYFYAASALNSSESVTIGAGGTGASPGGPGGNGPAGGAGGDTILGTNKARAKGGSGGAGGATGDGAGGQGGSANAAVAQTAGAAGDNGGSYGGGGGGGTATGTPHGPGGGGSIAGGLGGGAGGGISTANVAGNGGGGGLRAGGSGSANSGASPVNGTSTTGAAGGRSNTSPVAGGAGTFRGNGGGGGGSSLNGTTAGGGGAGADGWCRVTTW